MLNSFKKTVTYLLLLGTILSSFSACDNNEASSETQKGDMGTKDQEQIQAEETGSESEEYISDDISDINYDGASATFVAPTWYNAPSYIYASEINGEAVNDAFYDQRMEIQERFNVNIELSIYEDNGGGTALEKTIHEIVLSGDDTYDLVYNGDGCSARNGINGDYLNLRSISTINFDKPWFKGASEQLTIAGKLFFTSNPLSISSIYMNSVLVINKDVATNFNLTIPYDKVRAGTWYLDDMITMTESVNQDLNADGAMTEDDQYGFLTQYYSEMCVQSNLGGSLFIKNADGMVELVSDISKVIDVVEKYYKLLENGSNSIGAYNEGGSEAFVKGNSLFCYCEGRTLASSIRSADISFGILPFPKFDENQAEYSGAGYDIYWGIPITSQKAEMTGTLVSAMSCYNYNKIFPLVWEVVLGNKLSETPDDADMFKIIRDTQYVDLGYVCSMIDSAFTEYVFLFYNAEPGTVVSTIEKKEKMVTNALEILNSTFTELKG